MPRKSTKRSRAKSRKAWKNKRQYRNTLDQKAVVEGIAQDDLHKIIARLNLVFAGCEFVNGRIVPAGMGYMGHAVGKAQTRSQAKKHSAVFDRRDTVEKIEIKASDVLSVKVEGLLRSDGFKYDNVKRLWAHYGDERDFGTTYLDIPHERSMAANPKLVKIETVNADGDTIMVPFHRVEIPRRAVSLKTTAADSNGMAVKLPGTSLAAGSDNTMNEKTGEPLVPKRPKFRYDLNQNALVTSKTGSYSIFGVIEPKGLSYADDHNKPIGEPITRLIKCNLSLSDGNEVRLPVLGFRYKPRFVHQGQGLMIPAWFCAERDIRSDKLAEINPDLVRRMPVMTTS